jgi:beta-glucosidase-like glycosyl hydrolase
MRAVAGTWGVAGAAARFLGAGGDLALICRSTDARDQAVATIERDIERGALDPAPAARRRRAIRQLVDAAGPRPDLSVIGSAEHRALAEEVARRSAERG